MWVAGAKTAAMASAGMLLAPTRSPRPATALALRRSRNRRVEERRLLMME
jgi:hypothetical protein